MRSLLFVLFGFTLGVWLSWPGIFFPKNWKCFKDIISKSSDDKISFKAALAVSPNYFLKGMNKSKASRLRIVSDSCFR